jgi:hypothetical protein
LIVAVALEERGLGLDLDARFTTRRPLLTFARLLETCLGAAPLLGRHFVATKQGWTN